MSKKTSKGFTLIELLVVIAIIAVLSIVVILTLNPAELLRQARDSNRISDMSVAKSAISLYLADVSSNISIGSTTPFVYCYEDVSAANATTNGTTSASCKSGVAGAETFASDISSSSNAVTPRNVDGTGWIPVNFTKISSGAPIGQLPVDPLDNDGMHMYLYRTSSTLVFKMATKMESSKYSKGGAGDVESTDGGTNTGMYESGTNLSL